VLAGLAQRLGSSWEVLPGLVTKSRETPAMQGRSSAERRRLAAGPLRGSLRPGPGTSVRGARIVLVDDVFTEGSTLNEVARVLVGEGASEVAGLVLARACWRSGTGSAPG